jgi:hypothetical protein
MWSAMIWRLPPAITLEVQATLRRQDSFWRAVSLAGDHLVRSHSDGLNGHARIAATFGLGQHQGAGELRQKGVFGGHAGLHA